MKSMKICSAILAVLVILVSGCTNQNQPSDTVENLITNNENLRTVEIALPGMVCSGCVRSAQKAFEGIDGVVKAKVELETKKGTVIYDSSITSKEQIIQNPVIQAYDERF